MLETNTLTKFYFSIFGCSTEKTVQSHITLSAKPLAVQVFWVAHTRA